MANFENIIYSMFNSMIICYLLVLLESPDLPCIEIDVIYLLVRVHSDVIFTFVGQL